LNCYEGTYDANGIRCCRKCGTPKAYLNKAKEWVCKLCRLSKVLERVVPATKVCKSCDEEKPSESFHSDLRNKDGLQSRCRDCYANSYTTNKDSIRLKRVAWEKLNQHKKTAYENLRRSRKKKATPSWLSSSHLAEIGYKYWLARDLKMITGEDYEVDHIIPLTNRVVQGLHVPWNLQILPADLNRKKLNKLGEY
jgi:hypothetical protein